MTLPEYAEKKMTDIEKQKYMYDIMVIDDFVYEYLSSEYYGKFSNNPMEDDRILNEEIISSFAFATIVGYSMIVDIPNKKGRKIQKVSTVKGLIETEDPEEGIPFEVDTVKGMLSYIANKYLKIYESSISKYPNESDKFWHFYAISASCDILINEIEVHEERTDWFAQ